MSNLIEEFPNSMMSDI